MKNANKDDKKIIKFYVTLYFKGLLFIIGGICMFFWGTSFFSKGVTDFFNAKKTFASSRPNKIGYYILGAVSTALVQSSDATVILTMNMADEKLITTKDAVSVSFGARLGTTITAIWASIGELCVSPLVFALSFCSSLLLPEKYSKIKKLLFGIGLFFGGLIVLDFGSVYVQPLVRSLFQDNGNHFLLFLTGLSITAILQSSSAVTSVLAIMTINNAMSVENAIFLLLGATVGTTVTPLLAGFKMGKDAKYIAKCHIVFSLISGLVALPIVHFSSRTILSVLALFPKELSLASFGSIYGLLSSFLCLILQSPLEKLYTLLRSAFKKIAPSLKIFSKRRKETQK